jgi:hypothetical protein
MKLGDIKIIALQIMHADLTAEGINADNLSADALEGEYVNEIKAMPHLINQAIDIINVSDILPTKSFRADAVGDDDLNTIQVNLTDSRQRIVNIFYDSGTAIESGISPLFISDKVVMLPKCSRGEYVIEYKPVIDPITPYTPNKAEIDMPDSIARLIPYFIKAELYEEDEPSASQKAMEIFENGLTRYKTERASQTMVKAVYKWFS